MVITSGTAATARTCVEIKLLGRTLIMGCPIVHELSAWRFTAPLTPSTRASSLARGGRGWFLFDLLGRDRQRRARRRYELHQMSLPPRQRVHERQLYLSYFWGNVGFPYFDKKRKLWMGLAMWSTLFAMFVTAVRLCHYRQIKISYVQHIGSTWRLPIPRKELDTFWGCGPSFTSKEVT